MCTLLGRPGDLVPRNSLVDAYTTRIGGTPVLPAGADSLPDFTCPHCSKALVLLLQTHAPVSTAQERFLYLLGCASDKCPGDWKALRCQPNGPNPAAPAAPSEMTAGPSDASTGQQQSSSTAPEPRAKAASSWGEAGPPGEVEDTWGGGASGWGAGGGSSAGGGWGEQTAEGSGSGSAFDFDDLNAALDAVASKQSAQQAAGAARQQGSAHHSRHAAAGPAAGGAATSAGLQPCYAGGGPCFPSFYLTAHPEAAQASQQRLAKKELAHLQQLLSQYEQESGAAVAELAAAAGGGAAAAAAAGACLPSIEGGAESWAGEGYEPDAVLHADKARAAGLRPAFIKFSKRLAACPDQCARYSLGGVPLWPSEALPTPQPCSRCGAPASFELQLMAPAIHYLDESADWLEEEERDTAEAVAGKTEAEGTAAEDVGAAAESTGGGSAGILRPPHNWEWATVAVYSCSRSCGVEAGSAWVEEQAFVQNE